MAKRLVPHTTTVHGEVSCIMSGLPVENLECIYPMSCRDHSTNPSTVRLGDPRWLCPDCERAIAGEESGS